MLKPTLELPDDTVETGVFNLELTFSSVIAPREETMRRVFEGHLPVDLFARVFPSA